MLYIVKHNKDLSEAMDVAEIFYNHSKVKEEPVVGVKKYRNRKEHKKFFVTIIDMEV